MTEPIEDLVRSILISAVGARNHIIFVGLGLAAGVMTYITVDELIPVSHEYCTIILKHKISIGLLAGMIFGKILSVIFNV